MGFPNLTRIELKSLSAYLLSDYSISIPKKDLQKTSRKALPYSVNIACRFLTEMNGGTYISHTMERLKQIRRMEERL